MTTAAVQMSNYQLGDLLGRGASGSVYRALNFLTGETVAIKSISLVTLSPSALPDIMSEIDLLKNLNHPNIVKYKGFAQDKENLFIVLEYCENGSLQTILKKFGKFPESLVAVYISQVLEGLLYLHEQGVIHRDIKGANILTNKDGSVKLADFGVSSRAAGPVVDGGDHEVVGSPYWMAPEVIEQSGASTASDIWSVGCVVVELLEGKPPYGNLAPMQALWRIVQDESVKIPDGASPVVKDFLYHCFQKDPNLRITAKKLLRHPWMQSARRNLEVVSTAPLQTQSIPASPARSPKQSGIRAFSQADSLRRSSNSTKREAAGGETIRPKKPMTVYDEAVQRVQEWNEALNASPKALGTVRRLPASTSNPSKRTVNRSRGDIGPPLNIFGFPAMSSRSSNESVAAQASGSSNPSPAHGSSNPSTGLVQKTQHVSNVMQRQREVQGETWDDDFAADISLSRLNPHRDEALTSEERDQKTLKPSPSRHSPPDVRPLSTKLSASTSSRIVSEGDIEDYSDLATFEADAALQSKLASLKIKHNPKRGILHPDDLQSVKKLHSSLTPRPGISKAQIASATVTARSMPPPPLPPQRSQSTPSKIKTTPATLSPSTSGLSSTQSPRPALSPMGSRQNSLRSKADLTESQKELAKYTEMDDENYEDMFDASQVHSTLGKSTTNSLQMVKRANHSWSTDDDDHDPFAEIEDDFSGGEDNLEVQLLRDKKATLCASVNRIVDVLEPSTPASDLQQACDELLAMFEGSSGMGLEGHFVSSHGMMAVLELLESRLSREVVVRVLKIVNFVVINDVDALEAFCLIGGIPVILPYTSKKYALETRIEASSFIQQLTQSALTLQMFISCRGLRILVELLDEDYAENKFLILSSLEGIGSVFDLQSPTPRNDFCRMFVREGILDPLSSALLAILKDKEIEGDEPSTRAVNVLLLFCQVAQADGRVRDAFASRTVMIRLLKASEALPRKLLATAIKAIKHLSTSPQLIEILQNSNAMEVLVSLLGSNIKGAHANEICSHIFQTIYSMTRLSKARQEEAASSGIIPLLKKVIQSKSPLKQFALPILCDIANAGKVSRRLLWQNHGIKLYLDLLEDPYWRVSALDALLAWMSDETARVEDVILDKSASESIVQAFVQATGVSFEGILDPLLKILRLSTSVTSAISTTPFFRRLSESLSHPSKAVVKLNLLRLTRVVCDNHPDRATLVARFDLARIVDRLVHQDEAILVRQLAKEIYPTLIFGPPSDQPSSVKSARSAAIASSQTSLAATSASLSASTDPRVDPNSRSRTSSTMRRTTSDNGVSPNVLMDSRSTIEMAPPKALKTPIARDKIHSALNQATMVSLRDQGDEDVKSKHKRKISRSQLRDVQWQQDENGNLKILRTPSRQSFKSN
ncbi:hypothetical protein BD324DRAFT_644621 [Kockovaella imperatae]|uniref:non-specific serine/threonine protein kinase n=1 Tax=Kockovaella imperatae TaxID=4999 RepID=A0A1Y1UQ88_9TREE|nr:hypothetical protein BD324DRAFT_644621 [Kockovaella imperatae]ORX40201.1 hypothetical protein BD324DRAFT_644621 [Kockovaella imperatae]